jgi:pyruvate/2-oxoglutarate/acetoin dehydrogenase E1 component
MKYFDEIQHAMKELAEKADTIFIGQAVACPGTFMFNTLEGVPMSKRLEFPVVESLQMQFSLGVALGGLYPISVFPRQNFLGLAVGDLLNMVDKVADISGQDHNPRMLIRTSVGPDSPTHPGHQHVGDFSDAFHLMFKNIRIVRLDDPSEVQAAYRQAYLYQGPTLMIEVGNFYSQK